MAENCKNCGGPLYHFESPRKLFRCKSEGCLNSIQEYRRKNPQPKGGE